MHSGVSSVIFYIWDHQRVSSLSTLYSFPRWSSKGWLDFDPPAHNWIQFFFLIVHIMPMIFSAFYYRTKSLLLQFSFHLWRNCLAVTAISDNWCYVEVLFFVSNEIFLCLFWKASFTIQRHLQISASHFLTYYNDRKTTMTRRSKD